MITETVKKVAKELDSGLGSIKMGEPYFPSKDYRPRPFDTANFHKVDNNGNHRKIAFIDGGNQLIVETPTLALHLNRVYFNIFEGSRRLPVGFSKQLFEFFSVTSGSFKNEYPYYKTLIYPVNREYESILDDLPKLEFRPKTEITMEDRPILDIPRVSPIARRFAEWSLSKHVVKEFLDEGDILVMDGALKASFPKESKYSEGCYSLAESKGIIYTGLSKSSRLVTSTGMSLVGAIMELASNMQLDGAWYYHPIAESLSLKHAAELFILKLHKYSDRIFRYEIQAEQARKMKQEKLGEIISQLSMNSTDPCFLGYPYGLIDADDNARVREGEVQSYRLLILSEISKMGSWQKFLREMQAIDAHEVINSLRIGM